MTHEESRSHPCRTTNRRYAPVVVGRTQSAPDPVIAMEPAVRDRSGNRSVHGERSPATDSVARRVGGTDRSAKKGTNVTTSHYAGDGAALYAAMAANPEDDTLIKAWLDWLGEYADSPSCQKCEGRGDDGGHVYDRSMRGVCNVCDGKGRVPNASAAGAEFVQAQRELAKLTEGWKPENLMCLDMYLDPQDADDQAWKRRVYALQHDARTLLAANEQAWRSGPYSWGTGDGGGLLRKFDYSNQRDDVAHDHLVRKIGRAHV
jgi:hypothetical protein